MELGPIQKAWVRSLKEHPQRQLKKQLGKQLPKGGYKACCIGELCLIYNRMKSHKKLWNQGVLYSYSKGISSSTEVMRNWRQAGLRGSAGDIKGNHHDHKTLAGMNDSDYTWSQIAEFIEANPDKVFIKSV